MSRAKETLPPPLTWTSYSTAEFQRALRAEVAGSVLVLRPQRENDPSGAWTVHVDEVERGSASNLGIAMKRAERHAAEIAENVKRRAAPSDPVGLVAWLKGLAVVAGKRKVRIGVVADYDPGDGTEDAVTKWYVQHGSSGPSAWYPDSLVRPATREEVEAEIPGVGCRILESS